MTDGRTRSGVVADTLAFGAMQGGIEQMSVPWRRKHVRWENTVCQGGKFVGEIAPSTAGAQDREGGVEDATQRMRARSAASWQGREIVLEALPFSVREIARIQCTHAAEHPT